MSVGKNVKSVLSLMVFSFVFTIIQTRAQAQLNLSPLELSCDHLYFIQLSYVKNHINFSNLNRNLESRAVEKFVEKLDSSKLYLLESDVSKIKKILSGIINKTKNKDCASLQQAHDIYTKRLKERVEFAKKMLTPVKVTKKVNGKKVEVMESPLEFSLNTKITLDPEKRKRPRSISEANKFHKKYLQFQIASYMATDIKEDEARDHVLKSYDRVLRRIQGFKESDLYVQYLDAFAHGLDPHSSFFSRDALEDFEISMKLSLEGIGATLSSKDGFTVIEQLIPGGAAARSGQLKPKDKIVSVAQANSEFKNVIEMELRDVVKLIRGKKGTEVKLTILRKEDQGTKKFVVTLVRDKIKLEDEAASIDYIEREMNGVKKKIGLLNLPSFYADNGEGGRSAARDMKKILNEAHKKKVDAIVLDLSTNGGGSLDDAVKISGLFFKTGNVVKQSQKDGLAGQELVLADKDPDVDFSGPLVILISRVSASASEIVSGTLQSYKRAVIVGGDHTFGKGTVQSVTYLPRKLGALKTTVGMFFTAGGYSTQHRGVTSDIPMPSVYSTEEIGEKTLEYSLPPKKLKSFLSNSAYVSKGEGAWQPLTANVIKKIKSQSTVRVKKSEDFKKIVQDLKKAEKKNKEITIAEIVKGKDESDKESKASKNPEEEEENQYNLTKAQKKEKYLKRADIQEALNIAYDLSIELTRPTLKLGAKKVNTSDQAVELSN